MTKRVTHLSFSSAGGAGTVATRLSAAQAKLGWDSTVLTASSSDLRRSPLEHPGVTVSAALDNYVIRTPSFPALFSSVRDSRSALGTTLPPSDVYHLHWMNGLTQLDRVAELRRTPVVWTLHDMNPFTGGCHHSFACEQFVTGCAHCPAVRTPFEGRVQSTLARKSDTYSRWPGLHIVSPSAWLGAQATRSVALSGFPVSVIHNPLDPAFFEPKMNNDVRTPLFPEDHTVCAVVAAQLDDPIKGVDWAIEGFQKARQSRNDISLVLVGSGGESHKKVDGVTLVGPLGTQDLIGLLDHCDVILIPSQAENSPSVAYEAASRGVMPLVRATAGLPEVLTNLDAGFAFENPSELAALLVNTEVTSPWPQAKRDALGTKARALTSPDTVAQSYLDLYERAL